MSQDGLTGLQVVDVAVEMIDGHGEKHLVAAARVLGLTVTGARAIIEMCPESARSMGL